MAYVIAHEDVKANRKGRARDDGKWSWRTDFMVPAAGDTSSPQAFWSEQGPERHLRTHFHAHNQFQIFMTGGGTNGRHRIAPYQIHFARKFTPYGPIIANDQGCSFLTLRDSRDEGAQYLPESREKLESVPDRKPWQVSAGVDFPALNGAVAMQPLDGVQDENGLAAQAITMAPGAKSTGPDASNSGGQYLVVLEGSMLYKGQEHAAPTVCYIAANEGSLPLEAGQQGLKAVSLNFPRRTDTPAPLAKAGDQTGFKVWQCVLCAFVYDEAEGMPDEGIAPGTRWADVPETFGCPDCSATKADFEMIEI